MVPMAKMEKPSFDAALRDLRAAFRGLWKLEFCDIMFLETRMNTDDSEKIALNKLAHMG
jgi:hypothetical protein